MELRIPEEVLSIYQELLKHKFDTYLVGGCVRDMLMGRPVKDWDLASNAKPEEVLKLFPDAFYDNAFGTVGVPEEKYGVIEITTFRTERGYTDRRRPDSVEWGKTIEEDLSRRDFTVNAIAMQCHPERSEGSKISCTIIDPYKGQKDIETKTLRAVGDANTRFQEDALRLLRGVRFATQLGFTIEENTWNAVVANANLIQHVSGERVRDELLKILGSDYPYEGLMLLNSSVILQEILPELTEGKGVSQVRPGRHHTTDVFTHNMLSLKHCPSIDPIVRFATLLHDIGKPKVIGQDSEGHVTFYNHEITGARLAREICERLHFSKKQREKVITLIRWHMFTVDEKITDAAVRRFIRRVGVENVGDIMDLRIGDRLGGGTQTAESWRLKLFKKRVEGELAPKPFSIEDMAIDGNDIMSMLKIKPGPKVGEILRKLFEEVDEDLSKNNKEYLLKKVKELNKD